MQTVRADCIPAGESEREGVIVAEAVQAHTMIEPADAPVPSPLFRSEVIAYQAAHRQWGSIIELRPVGARVLSWGAVAVAGCAAVFLSTAEYARREPVAGYLKPTLGTAKVFVPQSGIIRDVRVAEGSPVRRGQTLMTVETPQVSGGGRDLNQAALDTLTNQRQMIARQLQAEEARTDAERKRLATLLDGQRQETDLLRGQIKRQDERVALGRSLLQSAQTLAGRGIMAEVDLKRRQQDMLDQERIRDDLGQQLTARLNQMVDTKVNLDQLPTTRNGVLQGLRNDLAWVDQRIAEAEGRQAFVVVAPVTGRVATLQAIPGRTADPRQLQMTIVPEGGDLVAEVLVPSRAIGFVAVGQPVRLLYEAYPYQKYGTYSGRVAAVAGTVIQAEEFAGPLKLAEPSYRVTVALDSPTVQVEGRPVALRPDLALRAEIVLDKRTLLHWLMSPLFGARNAVDADPLVRLWRGWSCPVCAAARDLAWTGLERAGIGARKLVAGLWRHSLAVHRASLAASRAESAPGQRERR